VANNSDDIRRLMNLMEGIREPTLLEGWVDGLKNKIHGHLGNQQRKQMANELKKEYYTWLGQTDRRGTIDDMVRFMAYRIGFKDDDIEAVLSRIGYDSNEIESAEDDEEEDRPEQTIRKGSEVQDDPEEEPESDEPKEPEEVTDDPRKYKASNGEWDRKRISARLDKLPLGTKLVLGSSKFVRSLGDKAEQTAESIVEDNGSDELISKEMVNQIMDASATRVNDQYLLNGPARDAEAAMMTRRGRKGQGQASPNIPNKEGSGRYDSKEMVNILKSDFQINNANSFADTLTRKVMKAPSISSLSDNDMHDLALLGWALIRARN